MHALQVELDVVFHVRGAGNRLYHGDTPIRCASHPAQVTAAGDPVDRKPAGIHIRPLDQIIDPAHRVPDLDSDRGVAAGVPVAQLSG